MRRLVVGTSLALSLATVPAVAGAAGPADVPVAAASCNPLTTPAHFTGSVPSPKDVLGFSLGQRPATDAEIDSYVHAVDAASDKVISGTFATSWQGRDLPYALVSNTYSLSRLTQIRNDLATLRDPATPASVAADLVRTTPTILWISANVHGNEPAGGDAVLRLLYHLADRDDCVARAILTNAVVGLMPVQNPDGRANDLRTNGYAFDMNRDWFARTQPEVAGKLDLLWKYPPQLFVDEHEMGGRSYFFPPNSDPIYSETPDAAYDEISGMYGDANKRLFSSNGWSFQTYQSGYDLFYQGYGDTVPTTEFGAAGMTYEQGTGSSYPDRTEHHFAAALTTLYTGAIHRESVLSTWRQIFVEAQDEGERCSLEKNATFNPGDSVLRQVPNRRVCGYFLRGTGAETRLVVRRLQLAHVQVDRLTAPLLVPDYRAYGAQPRSTALPAGTYWVSMAQPQKHWIQAMLNEDTYVPFPYFYDVSGWSNPLLAGIGGGTTGLHLSASLQRIPQLAQPAAPTLPADLPRIGIIDQRPDPTYEYQTTGWLQWRLAQDWKVPYTALAPEQVTAKALSKLDVLLVPNVDGGPTYQGLGASGRAALRNWVAAGGRYVGWQTGAHVAKALGLSSVQFAPTPASSPGALLSLTAPHPNTYALWDSYYSSRMTASSAVVAAFPAQVTVSGYAQNAQTLAGTAAEVVDRVGAGSTTVFSFEPNYRGYSDGTARLLFEAMLATPTPLSGSATLAVRAPSALDPAAVASTPTSAQHIAYEERGKS